MSNEFLERLKEEREQSISRLMKLRGFINTTDFGLLPDNHQQLLHVQQAIMTSYRNVLTARILLLSEQF